MEIRRGDYMPKGFRKDRAPAVSQTVVFGDVVYYRYPDSSRRSDRVYYKGWRNGIKTYLHVAIYEKTNGAIPERFEVHHKDENEAILYDVFAEGDIGKITAGELQINQDGDHLVFTKNPILILNKDGQKKSKPKKLVTNEQ